MKSALFNFFLPIDLVVETIVVQRTEFSATGFSILVTGDSVEASSVLALSASGSLSQ